MSTASPAPRSFALLVPLLLILGLLAAIAYFGLELWKSWHSSASGSTAVLLQAEKTLAGQLRARSEEPRLNSSQQPLSRMPSSA